MKERKEYQWNKQFQIFSFGQEGEGRSPPLSLYNF